MQVIDGIEVDVIQLADLRLDIARHGDVDHEDRLVLALFQRTLHRALAEDGQLAGRGTDDDVAVRQFVGNVREQHGVGAELLGQLAGTFQGAVGDDDTLDALIVQVARHQADGLASADQQRLAAVQVGEDLLGQAHRGKRHGYRVLADGGVGTHGLGGAEGGLEQTPEQRADGAGLARYGVGRLELAENLRFAEHHRVQPAGHAHHVPDRVVIAVHIGAGAQFVDAQTVIIGQPLQHFVAAELVLLQVQLAAVAGGEDRRLAAGRQPAQLLQRLDQLLRGEGNALAHLYRGGLVVDTEGDKGHAGSLRGNTGAGNCPTSPPREQLLRPIVPIDGSPHRPGQWACSKACVMMPRTSQGTSRYGPCPGITHDKAL